VFQLALNAAWTPTFFGAHQIFPALMLIVILWLAILMTMLAFRPVSGAAAVLFAPYLLWVSLATALNFEIWRLNP
jgi:tryptophan-rich sensory protein